MLKRKYCVILMAIAVLAAMSSSLQAKHVKVFLLGGQSNAAGSGLTSEYPAVYQSPQMDIEFWVGGRRAGDGVPDYAAWDRLASTAFGPLAPGSGNYLNGLYSGCELSLGRVLKDSLAGENIAIVKYGMSGSALKRGLRPDGPGDWDSDPAPLNGSFDGVRYNVFKNSAVMPAIAAIQARGDTYEIAGMFWMQGEADAGAAGAAAEYGQNLKKLIDAVRRDFNAPDMPFHIGLIRKSRPYAETVRKAMIDAGETDPRVHVIYTDDLSMNSDNVHYDASGQVELGSRFAKSWLLHSGTIRTEVIDPSDYSGIIRVACMGDSITYGAGISDREINSYPAQLQQLLGSGCEVGNFGRSGADVIHTNSKPYMSVVQYDYAQDFNPNVVVILLGINDTAEWDNNQYFRDDYKQIIDTMAAGPNSPKIWLCRMLPVYPYANYDLVMSNKWQADLYIEQIAWDRNVSLIDLYTPMLNKSSLFPDGLHPNAEGAGIMAQEVYGAITGNFGGLAMSGVAGDMEFISGQIVELSGRANAFAAVSLDFAGYSKTTTANASGRWQINVPPRAVGGPYTMMVTSGTDTLTFTGINIVDPAEPVSFKTGYGPAGNQASPVYGQSFTPNIGADVSDDSIPEEPALKSFTFRNATSYPDRHPDVDLYLNVYENYVSKDSPGTLIASSTNTVNPYAAGLGAKVTWEFEHVPLKKNVKYAAAFSTTNAAGSIYGSRFMLDTGNPYAGGAVLDTWTDWDAEFEAEFLFNRCTGLIVPDLDDDCDVDLADLALFASYWLEDMCGSCGGADFSGDYVVDGRDLAVLASQWLVAK